MALDMKKSQQNGHLMAILDLIAKPIDVHMSAIVYYPCAKFERNRARHVWDICADGRTDGAQSISPPGVCPRGGKPRIRYVHN